MENNYWASVWAKFRQDEVICIPSDYIIHADFMTHMDKNEIKLAFEKINSLYKSIYGDIAEQPSEFGMPLYPKNEYRVFSQQWRDSGQAVFNPFVLLYNLLICGDIKNGSVYIPIEKYKNLETHTKYHAGWALGKKVKNSHFLFKKLTDYGFVFEGLKNYKEINQDIIINYPDSILLLHLWKMLADKTHNVNRLPDFLYCHFRLLQNDMNNVDYGFGADDVADRVHTEAEKEFTYEMDKTLMSMGMFRKPSGGFECHGLAYYRTQKDIDTKKPYPFRMVTRNTDIENNVNESHKMIMMLRVRNFEKCRKYFDSCPDSVKSIFTTRDKGCGAAGRCGNGISYEIDGVSYWKCGCCFPTLRFKPNIKDIPHYIKLVELGEKK
jgi:hypothetical protein